jgi:hypothetical protein
MKEILGSFGIILFSKSCQGETHIKEILGSLG